MRMRAFSGAAPQSTPFSFSEFGRRAGRERGKYLATQIIIDAVARAFIISPLQLTARSRGPASVALARQTAMYLAHVVLGLSYTRAGRLFGRDRTTVAHACRLVEEMRDDAAFDTRLDALERALRARNELTCMLRDACSGVLR